MPFDTVTPAMIEDTVKRLTGIIEQTPPQYSAVKVDGKRAYDMARKDKAIEIPKRTITIFEFEITNIEFRLSILEFNAAKELIFEHWLTTLDKCSAVGLI
jgi:tRNA pseudouridine(55) synthase